MYRFALIGGILLALVAGAAAAIWFLGRKPPLPAPQSEKNINLALSAKKSTVRTGEPIRLDVILQNLGSQPVRLPPLHARDQGGEWVSSDGFSITNVHTFPELPLDSPQVRRPHLYFRPIDIPKKGTRTFKVNLSDIWEKIPPGRYRLCVEYKGTCEGFNVHLVSNEVTITVEP